MFSIVLPALLFFLFLLFYFFLSAEGIKPELLQSVFMGQISRRDADELYMRMESKRKWSLLLLGTCVIIFASTVAFVFWEKYLYFDDGTAVILVIGGIIASVVVMVFQIKNFFTARTYLNALKHSRPGSVINTHPLYNLDNIDQQLLEKISARKFADAEARGLLNIANAARAVNKRLLVFWAVYFAIGAFFWFDPFNFGVYSEYIQMLSFIIIIPAVSGLFKRFSNLGKNAQYINAIQAKYPFLNGPR